MGSQLRMTENRSNDMRAGRVGSDKPGHDGGWVAILADWHSSGAKTA